MTHHPNRAGAHWSTTLLGMALLGSMAGLSAQAGATAASTRIAAQPTQATAEAQATRNLITRLNGISSMQAAFVQTTRRNDRKPVAPGGLRPMMNVSQTLTGVMQVKRPGQFRWETRSPMQQLIVANGRQVWLYDPDLKQATRQTLDQQIANTPALLLSGNVQQIAWSYRISQPQPGQAYFVLYPRPTGDQDSLFSSLALRFNGNVPSQMILTDTLGQQTSISFSQVRLNSSLSASIFNFVPPKGTDVIEQ